MTRSIDLAGEFNAARWNAAHDDFDGPLMALGIDTLERRHVGAGLVRFEREGWQLADDGTPAIVAAVRGHDDGDDLVALDPRSLIESGTILDLLAIDLCPPHRWALRQKVVLFAGAASYEPFRPSPTRWHRRPIQWLREGEGVVPLTDDAGQVTRMLEQLKPGGIVIEDLEHGRELMQAWQRKRGTDDRPPRMFVTDGEGNRHDR